MALLPTFVMSNASPLVLTFSGKGGPNRSCNDCFGAGRAGVRAGAQRAPASAQVGAPDAPTGVGDGADGFGWPIIQPNTMTPSTINRTTFKKPRRFVWGARRGGVDVCDVAVAAKSRPQCLQTIA